VKARPLRRLWARTLPIGSVLRKWNPKPVQDALHVAYSQHLAQDRVPGVFIGLAFRGSLATLTIA
jgi:hypothetical protein